jgi:sn-glycerol 3-phosphate transport system substrate-binding protein
MLQLAALSALSSAACGRGTRTESGRIVSTLWFSYGGKNRQVLERLVAKFNASQSDVLIRATFQGDYFEALAKLRSAIAANAAPAMSHVVGEVIPYLHNAGVLEPLDDYDGAKNLDLVPALAQEGTYIAGANKPLVALPFNRSTPIMYMNEALLREAGIQTPSTWDELQAAAKALTKRSSSGNVAQYGFECPISWWFWVALVGQAGGTVMEADGTPVLGGDAGVRALQLWQRMVHEDKTMRPPPGRDYNAWEETNRDFLQQRAAIIYTSTAFLRYLEENARFKVVAAPLPKDKMRAVPTGGTFFVMTRSAPKEEKLAGFRFLQWMMRPEQTIDWATSTGYMPVATSAVRKLEDDGYYQKHPNDRVAMDQLSFAQPWPWAANLFRVQRECVDPLLEKAVLLPKDAKETMDLARKMAVED